MVEIGAVQEQQRAEHRRAVKNAADFSRRADVVADDRRQDLYRCLDDAHGLPADGKLTHAELAEASGWGRGWVRLAIANYRKRKAKVKT